MLQVSSDLISPHLTSPLYCCRSHLTSSHLTLPPLLPQVSSLTSSHFTTFIAVGLFSSHLISFHLTSPHPTGQDRRSMDWHASNWFMSSASLSLSITYFEHHSSRASRFPSFTHLEHHTFALAHTGVISTAQQHRPGEPGKLLQHADHHRSARLSALVPPLLSSQRAGPQGGVSVVCVRACVCIFVLVCMYMFMCMCVGVRVSVCMCVVIQPSYPDPNLVLLVPFFVHLFWCLIM